MNTTALQTPIAKIPVHRPPETNLARGKRVREEAVEILEHDELTAEEMAERFGICPIAMRRHLKTLVDSGRLVARANARRAQTWRVAA